MQAIILVGGQGTRLRPLTYETPKQMLPLVGVPMIEVVLDSLRNYGISEAVLSLGYLPDRFMEAYPDSTVAGVSVRYAVEPEPLDTAGAIKFAASAIDVRDTFLVINGDVLCDLDVSAMLDFHRASGASATIALHPVEDPSRFGVVPTDGDGRVLDFIEKPAPGEAPTNLINAGIYLFEPSALAEIPDGRRVSVERETFPNLAKRGELFAWPTDAYWLDTGTPASYLQANTDILGGADRMLDVPVTDGSWCHPQATVDPTATLVRAVIDRGCVVGPGAHVEDAVLLPGAVVQQGARVVSSIIGPHAVIGSLSELGPICVVGSGEHVAPESSLSGDVRLGGV